MEGGNFSSHCNKFFKRLNECFHKCFKKIRITSGSKKCQGDPEIQDKLNLKSSLRIFLKKNECKIARGIAEGKLIEIDDFLDEHCGSKNAEKVKKHFEGLETQDGNFSQLGFWKLNRVPIPPWLKFMKVDKF